MYGTAFAADIVKNENGMPMRTGAYVTPAWIPDPRFHDSGLWSFAVGLGQKSKTQNVAVGFLFNLLRPMSSNK